MDFNIPKFNSVVAEAKAKAPQLAGKIDEAAEELLCNPFIADVDGGLLILSDKSQNIYYARSRGNVCNCKAREYNKTCRHRLCDRLVRMYQWGARKDC